MKNDYLIRLIDRVIDSALHKYFEPSLINQLKSAKFKNTLIGIEELADMDDDSYISISQHVYYMLLLDLKEKLKLPNP